jgi:pimeloyl-ACP methyl ester carboxylesterase
VSATYKDLIKFLEALKVKKKIQAPVALVTPSASGFTMATWAAAASTVKDTLPKYIERWIPVAAVAFVRAPDQDVQRLQALLPILAIYGDKDRPGKQSSERLQTLAGATILEMAGTHPCYLDSPKEFVGEMIKFVD